MNDLIFDRNVLTLIFSKLIEITKKERGCEYAYECIKSCSDVCSKWETTITRCLGRHLTFPKKIETSKCEITEGCFSLNEICLGHKKLEYQLRFNMDFEFRLLAGQNKVVPTFYFEPKIKHTDQFCPWCCICYFNKHRKHHRKKCVPQN